jgi:hypothetical protein
MISRRSINRYLTAPAIIRTPGLLMQIRTARPIRPDLFALLPTTGFDTAGVRFELYTTWFRAARDEAGVITGLMSSGGRRCILK